MKRVTALLISVLLSLSVLSFGMGSDSYALTGGYVCGYEEEHTHTQSCYHEVAVCGKEEHVPLCGKTEHLHTLDCCNVIKTEICGLPEHAHNVYCFNEAGDIICGMAEHSHTEGCYVISYELICGKEEHSHVPSCIPVNENGQPYEIHVHTSSCWQVQCTCGKREHKHDPVACMFASFEGVENEAVWSLSIPYERFVGNWATDVVAVAYSQLGYTENIYNTVLAEDGKTRLGYTRYGHWYGYPYGDWCAMFAAFCMHYAGIPAEAMPVAPGVETWIQKLQKVNLFETSPFYEPKPGDLVFIADNGAIPNHMGIVQQWTSSQQDEAYGTTIKYGAATGCMRIIQGNKEDAVKFVDINIPSYTVVGFVSMEKVMRRWNNINAVSVTCGSDVLELNYGSELDVNSFENVIAVRCFTNSSYYSEALRCSLENLESLGVKPDKSLIKLYEVAGLRSGVFCELPIPEKISYVSGVVKTPVVKAFEIDGRLVVMIYG